MITIKNDIKEKKKQRKKYLTPCATVLLICSLAACAGNVIKIRKYHYIRTDMSIKHICFFMQKTLDKPAPKCGEAP